MGYVFVYVRKHTQINLILSLSLSGLWMALISMFLATELIVGFVDLSLLFILGTIVGIAFSLITLSARYIPAPVSSMFMPLETFFGVLFVWVVIGERPNLMTIISGMIIVGTLMVVSYFELKANKSEAL
jgi:drug/metabolite transporter (DMT)-like permease